MMEARTGLLLGALGGPHTFGGQAARMMLERYPQFTGELRFYPTAEDAQAAIDRGEIDATCSPDQMAATGFHPGIQQRVYGGASPRYVIAEVVHTYHCSLLVKPGARLKDVKRVLGHTGSITQSRHWLEKHLPQAEIEIVDTSSFGAAMTVLEGDGSIASVGTPEAARAYGLEIAAAEIDGGSSASYWGTAGQPHFSESPTRLVVTGAFDGDGTLGDVIVALGRAGFSIQTVSSRATGKVLYQYHYVLRLAGAGSLQSVQDALAPYPAARLAGAFKARD